MDSEPIIFLDFDGVVSNSKCLKPFLDKKGLLKGDVLDPACCARINRLISITHAKVVIHSSWVHIDTPGYIITKLREADFNIHSLHEDWICNNSLDKLAAITGWLIKHDKLMSKFIVIDDDKIGNLPQVQIINGWTLGGIQDNHITLAAKMLI